MCPDQEGLGSLILYEIDLAKGTGEDSEVIDGEDCTKLKDDLATLTP